MYASPLIVLPKIKFRITVNPLLELPDHFPECEIALHIPGRTGGGSQIIDVWTSGRKLIACPFLKKGRSDDLLFHSQADFPKSSTRPKSQPRGALPRTSESIGKKEIPTAQIAINLLLPASQEVTAYLSLHLRPQTPAKNIVQDLLRVEILAFDLLTTGKETKGEYRDLPAFKAW
jgi:hypothetical protein